MGRLLDGKWVTEDLGPDAQGRYVRRATLFRDWVRADGSTPYAPTPGRYVLYASWACGWTHRVLLARALKKLEAAIPVIYALPFMGPEGWGFGGADTENGTDWLWQLYLRARPGYTGRVSVPVLWDTETGTIVSNESADLLAMFDREFDAHGDATVRLYPEGLEAEIEAMVQANYGPVNNGVYRAGFAQSQGAHTEAVTALFSRLGELEEHLRTHRYLMGASPTAADFCLFPTLYRFDAVYYTHFKCNVRHLYEYPNLWAYARDVYSLPGVRGTCNLPQAIEHYYTSHESIHPRRYIPLGPSADRVDWEEPHDRDGISC
ncbi:MAG: glutathione S-transferase family protein [Deltaproteobacteria bacterium]|nr:MAG: glutathione S-transferase family protein [Deltaproteobacteria bacterium]